MKSEQHLISQIEAAFASTPHPGDANLLHPESHDADEIKPLLGFRSWRDLPPGVLARNSESLAFLAPSAFRFFLPAFLRHALLSLTSSDRTVDIVIYQLSPGRGELREYSLSQFSEFRPAEVQAVVGLLAHVASLPELADTEAAEETLSYWRARAEGAA